MEELLNKLLDDGWEISMVKCLDRSGPGGAPEDPQSPRVINLILRRDKNIRIGRAPTLRAAFDEAVGKTSGWETEDWEERSEPEFLVYLQEWKTNEVVSMSFLHRYDFTRVTWLWYADKDRFLRRVSTWQPGTQDLPLIEFTVTDCPVAIEWPDVTLGEAADAGLVSVWRSGGHVFRRDDKGQWLCDLCHEAPANKTPSLYEPVCPQAES